MTDPKSEYEFEKRFTNARATPLFQAKRENFWGAHTTDIAAYADMFLTRLGVSEKTPPLSPADRRLLERFCSLHHSNINWYTDKIDRKRQSQIVYFVISAGLVVLIPTVLAYSQTFEATTALAPQIGGFITGLIGLHRSIQTWFEKRNMIATWWEASANLKGDLYDLEDRWRGREDVVIHLDTKSDEALLNSNLRAELELGITKAKKIVRKEKDAFFKKLGEHRGLDLASVIGAAQKDSAVIMTDFLPPNAKKEVEAMVADGRETAAIDDLETELQRLDAILNATESEVSSLPKDKGSEIKSLTAFYEKTRAVRDSVEANIASKKAAKLA